MKKLIIATIAIITIIISGTGVLITKAKNELIQKQTEINNLVSGDENNENVNNETSKEKTLNLYGTYSQNDLLISEKTIEHEALIEPIEIKQISGLKYKALEDKINKNIEDKIIKTIDEFYAEGNFVNRSVYMSECANFSNVISLCCHISGRNNNGEYVSKSIGFNYNLINGEELKFKDLFIVDADIQTIVRSALYKKLEESQESYWDEEKGKWMETKWEYNYATESCDEVTAEYVPYLTENEINKIVKQFVKNAKFEFYFTESEITIAEPEACSVKFEEFADMVVIYDKYLTNKSLYERDDIGFDNILTCSRENVIRENYLYKKTSYELDNFFYDISFKKDFYDEENITEKLMAQKMNQCLDEINFKIAEYRKLAVNNPDKMYILLLKPAVSIGNGDFKGTSNYSDYEYHNLVSVTYNEKIISGDITKKDELLYKLLGTYIYQNLGMYMGIYDGINQVMHEDYHFEEPVEENIEFYVFDALTGSEIADIRRIFKDEVDYKSLLDKVFKDENVFKYYYESGERIERTDEEIEEILSKTEYKFNATSIYAFVDGKYDQFKFVPLTSKGIWPYLNLKKLNYYILPESDKTELSENELHEMSKINLNKAYNEIFARHGHEFKNKELKEYFERMIWYTPIEGKIVSLEELSEIERNNANLIKSVIDTKN